MVVSLVQTRDVGHSLLHAKPVVKKMEEHGRGPIAAIKKQFHKTFSKRNLRRRIPYLEWLPNYNLECLEGDILAGFTVGLTVIPQGIAYANVAGLAPNYGLYSAFMGCFIYMFFGSCKDITIGPTAIMALMTHEYSGAGGPDFAILLCFLSGIIILASGICNLGFLITFISKPVITGFTSAAAITIACTQIKGIFGISISAEGVIETIKKLAENIDEFRWQDFTLGSACIVALLLMRKIKDLKAVKPNPDDQTCMRILRKIGFLTSVGRNAIIVVICCILAYCLDANQPFRLTGEVQPGLPNFQLPPFQTVVDNETLYFPDMISSLGAGVAIIPLISILESIAIASAFAGNKTIDATQEMLALGLCNLAGSFLQSMPVTGSFSRTAVNASSGVKTQAGGVVTGILVILALAVLTPYFKYIPKACLSAVIICAVIFMVEYEAVLPIWRAQPLDFIPLWFSFITCLFWKLEYGILIGVAANICVLLYRIARTKVDVNIIMKQDGDELAYVVVEPQDGLLFPSVDHVRAQITKAGLRNAQGTVPVVVDCTHFTAVDYTAAKGIRGICNDFANRQQTLIFTNVRPSMQSGMSSLSESITIASPDQLHSILKVNSPIMSLTGHSANSQINVSLENGDRTYAAEEEESNLLPNSGEPKPVIVERKN